MKIRTDVVDMLRDGLTDSQIARHAHVCRRTVAAARDALGLPKARPGNKSAPTIAHALAARSRSVNDGHREWTGMFSNGVPVLRIHGIRTTAYRAAWIDLHGRQPIGPVKPGCDRPGCVAPDHMDDRPARERNRAIFNALFGGSA